MEIRRQGHEMKAMLREDARSVLNEEANKKKKLEEKKPPPQPKERRTSVVALGRARNWRRALTEFAALSGEERLPRPNSGKKLEPPRTWNHVKSLPPWPFLPQDPRWGGTEEGVGSSTTKNAAPQAVRTEGTVDLNPMEADWGDDDTSSGAMPSAWTTNLPLQKEGRLEEMSSSLATALSTRPTHCDYYWPWGPQRRPSELRGEAHGPESQVAAFAANRGETAEGLEPNTSLVNAAATAYTRGCDLGNCQFSEVDPPKVDVLSHGLVLSLRS
ncbi:unnamed protein product [Symbiodinium microadriaticum]|nr:unnamed protein product [Symbiodinium microadriaticum]CAE7946413.1 unnamed protein product [Symbiodinium sp. KB8]